MGVETSHIVVLGGGFGGVYTARHLCRKLKRAGLDNVRISLVSEENYIVFQPFLPEVISGALGTLHIISPIRRIVPQAELHVRAVEAIDLQQRSITLAPGHIPRRPEITYDHLVLAMGTRLAQAMVPGLAEHAIPFKYLGDALRLRNHLVHVLEEAAITSDDQERQRLLTFVVAGGGFSGVECIAEMHDFLQHAVRSYAGVSKSELKVILLQSGEKILPEMKPSLAQFAHRILERRGVEIRTNVRLTSVTAQAALTRDKQTKEELFIPTRTVVATVPVEPHPLLAALPLAAQKGRIEVNENLQSSDSDHVWAVGDCAAIPLADGSFAPPTAQHAVREAKICAHNIVASLRDRKLKPFTFQSLGSLASLGRGSAVAQVFGIKISGFLAWLLWRGVYLMKFPGFDRKLRILADWMMDLFLPRDITEVRIFPPAAVRREHFEPGEVLFEQGDVGDRIHFVIDGKAEIEVDGNQVATADKGDAIGEIALVRDCPRTATVRAKTAMDTASFSRDTFHALVAHFPGVEEALGEIIERHLGVNCTTEFTEQLNE